MHAKAAPAALVPHLQALASQTQQLWDAGLLRPGERCVLSETLVIAAAGSTPDIQKQVQHVVCPRLSTSLRHIAMTRGQCVMPCCVPSPDAAIGKACGCTAWLMLLYPTAQVVEWVLSPIRAAWTNQDWLRHLATPDAFYARFVNITAAADGRAEVHDKHFASPRTCLLM